MATIRAAWKRSVRVREYETETLELGVERDWDLKDGKLVQASADMCRDLARAGDALLVERMTDRMEGATKVGKQRPAAPDRDPFVG